MPTKEVHKLMGDKKPDLLGL